MRTEITNRYHQNNIEEINVDRLSILLNNELFELESKNAELEKSYLHLMNIKVELGLKFEFLHEQISELYIQELENEELSVEEDEEIIRLQLETNIIEVKLGAVSNHIEQIILEKTKLDKAIVRMKKRSQNKSNTISEFNLVSSV